MMKLLQLFLLTIALPVLQTAPVYFLLVTPTAEVPVKKQSPAAGSIMYRIIRVAGNTYGYDIYCNGHLLIHQPSIPCIKGDKGFSTKGDARKVALLVTKKIRNGMMPPSLNLEELKNLGVLHSSR